MTIPQVLLFSSVLLSSRDFNSILDKLLPFSQAIMTFTIPGNVRGCIAFYFGSDEIQRGMREKKERGKGLARVLLNGEEIEEVWDGRALVVEKIISAGTHQFIAKKRVL
jgi:hypothetical protein